MVNINLNWGKACFFSYVLVDYSYCLGACHWLWMPFWPPLLTVGEQFVENMSSHIRIKLIMWLLYWFKLNPATEHSANPFGWQTLAPNQGDPFDPMPYRELRRAHHGGNVCGTFWFVLVDDPDIVLYSYCMNPTERELFVPAWTKIVVKLSTKSTFYLKECHLSFKIQMQFS